MKLKELKERINSFPPDRDDWEVILYVDEEGNILCKALTWEEFKRNAKKCLFIYP